MPETPKPAEKPKDATPKPEKAPETVTSNDVGKQTKTKADK